MKLLFEDDSSPFAKATAAWSPLTLGSALKAWWNADDTSTGSVATWTDRVASVALTAAAGLQAVSAATSFNGVKRGLTFDGVDDCFVGTTLTALPTGSTAGEVWALVDSTGDPTTDTGTTRTIVSYGGASGATVRQLRRGSASPHRPQVLDGSTALTGTKAVLDGKFIIGGNFSGTTEAGRVNGSDSSPATATIATLNTGTTRIRIGSAAGASASTFWLGVIRHVMVTATLTANQRLQLEGWLAWDASLAGTLLPTTHPFAVEQP